MKESKKSFENVYVKAPAIYHKLLGRSRKEVERFWSRYFLVNFNGQKTKNMSKTTAVLIF